MSLIDHKNGENWAEVFKNKLWNNQQEALRVTLDYLSEERSEQAMVRMPTGTGKTGVIAILSQLHNTKKRCIIVAPFANLANQLTNDVSDFFWQKIGHLDGITSKNCVVGKPSNFISTIEAMKDSGIVVCTYQTLAALRQDANKFNKIKKWVDLVLVDEGHREPAPLWSKAVRDLNEHIVLFTATPYRNDLLYFNISSEYYYTYTYVEADEDKIIRNVDFVESDWCQNSPQGANDFLKSVIKHVAKIEADGGEIKVIIRCETSDRIEDLVDRLKKDHSESAIGIHEQFSGKNDPDLKSQVPRKPREVKKKYWVHQWKLLEGLDDDTFQVVAIYDEFKNARNLVQQVGRVIRNPNGKKRKTAVVLGNQDSKQKQLWSRFIEYEQNVRLRREQGSSELKAFEDYVASLSASPLFYFLGDFKRQLTENEVTKPRGIVLMKKSILLRRVKSNFNLDKFLRKLEQESFAGEVVRFGSKDQDKSSYLQLFQAWQQSDVVNDAFLEPKLGYVYVYVSGDILVFSNSEGKVPPCLYTSSSEIEVEALRRLIPEDGSAIKEISLINGGLGQHSYRRRSLTTASLRDMPPALSDYSNVCSTALCEVQVTKDKKARRYIGFTKGRTSERNTPTVEYNKFQQWVDQIVSVISDDKLESDNVLERYAQPVSTDKSSPVHILFNLENQDVDMSRLANPVASANVDDLWLVRNNKFIGELDDTLFKAEIRLKTDTGRFEIASAHLNECRLRGPDGQWQNLLIYLNSSQEFRLLLESQVTYTQGKFFKANQFPWRGGGSGYNLKNLLHECSALQNTINEKGDRTSWANKSVFGTIVDKRSSIYTNNIAPEFLVCYDVVQPTEFADFFALYEKEKRIIMIHAKNSKNGTSKTTSASSFYDVCGQAVRYLGFFNPTDNETKLSVEKLKKKWCPDKDQYQRKKRLVWAPSGFGESKTVKAFNNAIADPTYTREVWIVMGKGVSKSHFDSFIDKTNPKANEKELCLLLQSTWCATAALGAELKVFCMP